MPALIHGLWDFSLISGQIVPESRYFVGGLAILVMIVLPIVVFFRPTKIEPATS